MRVLWLSGNPSNYQSGGKADSRGGWISSLETEMASKVELGVAFVLNGESGKVVRGGVTYYPVTNPFESGRMGRVLKFLIGHSFERAILMSAYGKIIDDFKPDIIQVFGTEHLYGLAVRETSLPSVVHIQGVLNDYLRTFLPNDMMLQDWFLSGKTFSGIFGKIWYYVRFRRRAKVEAKIFASARNFMGRTAYDKAQMLKYNAGAAYYHVDEMLRAPFYKAAGKWRRPDANVIVSTISEAPYKGMDVVLRTAAMLKRRYGLSLRWIVFGNVDASFFEAFTGISCDSCGVEAAGTANAETIASALEAASVYVHPSYCENSPNSLCEAQIVGVPVVASNVGGISSLVEDSVTGFLAEAGDPADFAAKIHALLSSPPLSEKISAQAVKAASRRHDKSVITDTLIGVYNRIICG